MKKIAVFFDAPGFDDYPFNRDTYRAAYYELASLLWSKGAQLCIVRTEEAYLGGNIFAFAWCYEGKEFWKHDKPLTADLLFDKGLGKFMPDAKAKLLNPLSLDRLCVDKWLTYQAFPDFFPVTLRVENQNELIGALARIPGDIIVAKPLDGEEGAGVVIGSRDEVRDAVQHFPYLLQEFIDTSSGIPGVVEGRHDFRIINVNGDIVNSFVRTPAPGKMVANTAQGGTKQDVPAEKIPPEALALFAKIETYMREHFPTRVYSVDMGRHADGQWKLIELNSKPGLTPRAQGPRAAAYQERLAELMLAAA